MENTRKQEIEAALAHIANLMKTVRPDINITLEYWVGDDGLSEFQKEWHCVAWGDEHIRIYKHDPNSYLLYVVHIGADSVLTAMSELMDLLSWKF